MVMGHKCIIIYYIYTIDINDYQCIVIQPKYPLTSAIVSFSEWQTESHMTEKNNIVL